MSEESPCVGVCMMDDSGTCIGCGRTQAEIDGWPAGRDTEEGDRTAASGLAGG